MVGQLQRNVKLMAETSNSAEHTIGNKKKERGAKFLVHDLGSNDNSFLDTVVQSVKGSAGINLRVEGYA